jgi:type IV pilus assembly protein PilW
MISIAIGLLLLTVLVTLFANNSAARNEIDKSSRQIENGRYALQVLADDIRHAGYYGPLANAPTLDGSIVSLPDPCSTSIADIRANLGLPVQGYAGAASATAIDPGKLSCVSTAAAGYKPNTAVLVVRRANTSSLGFASGSFNIQVSGCAGDSTSYIVDSVSANFTLHKNSSPGCTPITSAPTADITPLDTRIYFISTCSNTNCSASGTTSTPTLKRADITPNGTTITPIVDGIENMQLDYGIDNAPSPKDGVPDVYTNSTLHTGTTPSNITEWQDVMSVRIYVLARNIDQTVGYSDPKTYQLGPASVTPADSYKRHAYSELVRLNNPAGRRE